MILKRNQLKSIYDGLENTEKTQWALNSNYSSYQGLYKYLRDGGDDAAYDRIIQGLRKTVGQERFKSLTDVLIRINNQEIIQEGSVDTSELEDSVETVKTCILSNINKFNDINKLIVIEKTLQNVTELIKNQIQRIELIKEIKDINK